MREWLNTLRLRLKAVMRRGQLDRDLQDEVAFHVAMREQHLRREGKADPQLSAQRRFGNMTRVVEDCRDAWTFVTFERLLADLRYAARSLFRQPGFCIVAILTLALGIGANSAVFSAIDTILIRPLAFPDGNQLTIVEQFTSSGRNSASPVAPLRLADWDRMNSSFQSISGYYTEDISETSAALPEKITRAWVAPRFFQTWGIQPALGRGFTPEEEKFRGPPAVVISDRLWRRRFGADPAAVGRQLRVERSALTVVGVMPASFLFPDHSVEFWAPSPLDAPYAQNRAATWFTAIGRLKPGVTLEQARLDMATVQSQLGQSFPATDRDLVVHIRALKEVTVGGAGRSLWILYGSVSLLLLIACTNIAALMLARTAGREQEISLRFSLGASRNSVLTRLLAEAFLLALAGSALGLVLASSAAGFFRSLAGSLPRVEEIRLNWMLVIYSLVCAVGATFLCGLLPAIRSIRRSLRGSLVHGGRNPVSGGHPLQWLLVGVQIALSVTLLVGAGLFLRSFQELGRVAPGFDVAHILTFRISASWAETTDPRAVWRRVDDTLESLRALPGVEGAATSLNIPGVGSPLRGELRIVEADTDPNRKIAAASRIVSTGYFETMRIPVLAGDACSQSAVSTILVNRTFADTYMGGDSGIGHHIDNVPPNPYVRPGRIIGLVGDAREEGLNREPGPLVYWCNSAPVPTPVFLVRTAAEPIMLAETIRRKIHELQPNRSVFDLTPLEDQLDQTVAENRLRTILLTSFAVIAVALACMGVYGTLSYLVNMRRREVGLRIALGALPHEIVMQFLRAGLRVCFLGCLAGLILAAASGRALAGLLYGVSSSDPMTFVAVLLLVLTSGAFASLFPAIRASRVRPIQVLREE